MICISCFYEDINHEMGIHNNLVVERKAFKVDGNNGIKITCKSSELKSVDYFDCDENKGFQYIEFSNLLAHDDQIKAKINELKNCKELPKKLNAQIRKDFAKEIHRELVQKFKDSMNIKDEMPKYIENIPVGFSSVGRFVIVVAPIQEGRRSEVARLIDYWKDSIRKGLPSKFLTEIVILPLDILCQQIHLELEKKAS